MRPSYLGPEGVFGHLGIGNETDTGLRQLHHRFHYAECLKLGQERGGGTGMSQIQKLVDAWRGSKVTYETRLVSKQPKLTEPSFDTILIKDVSFACFMK